MGFFASRGLAFFIDDIGTLIPKSQGVLGATGPGACERAFCSGPPTPVDSRLERVINAVWE